ncbi:hypothetical protein ABZ851_30800 [Streptomyces sp. NPDC047049]|uniref:hypothetical protein n=1 Tax=Streptomyces sp. NPDC047049 TaxID=3156688 RepID=UPI0033C0037F
MTAQDPRITSGTFLRGGEDKTTSEIDLSSLLAAAAEATDVRTNRVLMVDLDPQRSDEDWTPVLIDTPGCFHDLPQATPDDSLPPLPLPGPIYPNAG